LWDLHEDTSEIQLDLETHINVRAVDGRTPPQREATIWDLIKTGALGIRQFLVSHRFFEARRLLPEKSYKPMSSEEGREFFQYH